MTDEEREAAQAAFVAAQAEIRNGPHREVDGVAVALTADEIAEAEARDAEWNAGALERARAEALERVDFAAGAARAKYITVAPGQESTYQLKLAEARAYPDGEAVILTAEAEATGVSVATVAATVLATAAQWVQLAAMIEGTRLEAKHAIRAATTVEDIAAAIPSAEVWP